MLNNIIHKPINELIFAEYNPRQLTDEQYKHLKDSITRFGLVDPIIINKNKDRNGIIIGGHQRVKVAKTMGIEKVPCVEIDLTYEKERELNIRLNKNTGGWDYDSLADLFDMKELTDWGFNEKSLLGLFDDIDYSILEDESLNRTLDDMESNTRKAIQIEFTLEDYEEATELVKELRTRHEYIGGVVLQWLRTAK